MMYKQWYGFGFILLMLSSFSLLADTGESEELTAEEQEYIAMIEGVLDSLNKQDGVIRLPEASASLDVPEGFYYLDPADSEKVLTQLWSNPPGNKTLGMLVPADKFLLDDDSWAVTIGYEEDGYVSDEDAAEIDYNDLLKNMQADTRQESKYRVEQGYEAIELVGWAASPYYDSAEHKMHWAQELKFGEMDVNTLNYNIRVLGRRGVLVLNFIAGIDQQGEIEKNLDAVLAMAQFDPGSQYADFNPNTDKVAAYGLGALVAGKVLAKTGVLSALLIFFKKFGIFILLGIGALLKKVFSGRKEA